MFGGGCPLRSDIFESVAAEIIGAMILGGVLAAEVRHVCSFVCLFACLFSGMRVLSGTELTRCATLGVLRLASLALSR